MWSDNSLWFLICISLMISMLSISSFAYLPICLLWKNVYSDILSIILIGFNFCCCCCCMSCLYIWDINFLVIPFENIFSGSSASTLVCAVRSWALKLARLLSRGSCGPKASLGGLPAGRWICVSPLHPNYLLSLRWSSTDGAYRLVGEAGSQG